MSLLRLTFDFTRKGTTSTKMDIVPESLGLFIRTIKIWRTLENIKSDNDILNVFYYQFLVDKTDSQKY